MFGIADFAGGVASRKVNVLTVTLISNIVGAIAAGVLVLVFGGRMSIGAVAWGAAAGGVGVVGLVMLYSGLATGPARLVSPLSGVIAALIPVLVGLAVGERPGRLAIVGLVLAPPAIWLVAGGGAVRASSRAIGLAIGAGVGFGVFFVLLARTPGDGGAVPLLAARLGSTALLASVTLARGSDRAVAGRRRTVALAAATGAVDMAANGLFLWASRLGALSVVGALTSLYPVSTVILAVVVFRERLTRAQAFGLVIAVTSAALLS